MSPRNSVILAVVAAIVLFAGWQFGPATMPGVETTVSPGTLVFPNLAPKLQDAAKVEIVHQGKTLVIARQPDGVWGLADRGGFRVQQDKLRELLTGLTELRITEPRTSEPSQYARLGVGDPSKPTGTSNLVRVLDKDGKPIVALIVGHSRTRTQGDVPQSVYIRRPGEQRSWLAEGQLSVDADPQLWFDRDLADIGKAKIASVTVTRGGAVLEFGRDGDAPVLKSPADHPKLDDYKVSQVFDSLDGLSLIDVKPGPAPVGERLGTAHIVGKDGLVVDVTVFKSGKDIWLQMAASGDGTAKAEAAAMQKRLGGWNFQVGSWKEQAFVPTLDDLKAAPPERRRRRSPPNDDTADDRTRVSREYPARPIVGIGVAVLRADVPAVLLVRRGKAPNLGAWSLPGGAQELGETAEDAARRELEEEAGLRVGPMLLAAHVDSIHHAPDGRVQYHYTIIDFAAAWIGGDPVAGGDVTEATWAPLDRLDAYALWSEAHRVIGIARGLLGC